jgi:hypothetical protein
MPEVALTAPANLQPMMEEAMGQGLENEWEKELRMLLELVQSHPSAEMTRERERIAVLNNLIATHHKTGTRPAQPVTH